MTSSQNHASKEGYSTPSSRRRCSPEGGTQLSLSSYAPFRKDCETLPFDTETDAALYLLEEFRKGAIVSEEHIETAHAILRGDQPMFVYEEKQPDGTLLLSLHNEVRHKSRESSLSAAARPGGWPDFS